jgi:MraZ protein
LVFRGTHDHNFDAKNRLTIPARYREALAGKVVMALSLDQRPCVGIWLEEEYDRYTRDVLGDLSARSTDRADLARYIFASSQEGELDAAGRLMVPTAMTQELGLGREVRVAGVGDHLEVWDPAAWETHQAAMRSRVAQITERDGHPA